MLFYTYIIDVLGNLKYQKLVKHFYKFILRFSQKKNDIKINETVTLLDEH